MLTFVVQMCIIKYFNFMRCEGARRWKIGFCSPLSDGTGGKSKWREEGRRRKRRNVRNLKLRFFPSINFTLTFHIELLHFRQHFSQSFRGPLHFRRFSREIYFHCICLRYSMSLICTLNVGIASWTFTAGMRWEKGILSGSVGSRRHILVH